MRHDVANKFGKLADLGNEASVEQFFVGRLLSDLGYEDRQIRPKATLDELSISTGRKSKKWRPDYALQINGKVRWICEAKGVDERLDDWVGQCSSYCLELNKLHVDNPVEYFLLTNGVTTRLYRWDSAEPIVEAEFRDFVAGNINYARLRQVLSPNAFVIPRQRGGDEATLTLRRRSVSELNLDFAWAHRLIYKRENLSYTAAFMEFVKVVFLKLWSDREVHSSPLADTSVAGATTVPVDVVRFSRHWIEKHEKDTPNPLDAILFRRRLDNFEMEISRGNKKRIFEPDERLNLSPDTLKAIADRLEAVDLISIDADLNGRMFETFLNSTLRGKALGQYFTPRSVVKLATGLARLQASPEHTDRVIDACCGTGGFLIEALAKMWAQIDANQSLSNVEREALRSKVATECLIGVDVARDPALARIARINMYLHGDGGSSIYQLDALDKKLRIPSTDSPELSREKAELRSRIAAKGNAGLADVALTNPPFAKEYNRNQAWERQFLEDYELAYDDRGGAKRPLASLNSMVMFLERYHDLLGPKGRLVTVVDDSILGSSRHRRVRDWIRRRWIIKAVVSLPGDAFQRSQARVKTSVIVLQKRESAAEQQPSVFMYYCTAVGVDDAPRQRVLPIDEENRKKATEEIDRVIRLYEAFQRGAPEAASWTVPAEALVDRLDVKACLPSSGRKVAEWEALGLDVVPVENLMAPVSLAEPLDANRLVDTEAADELVTYLRVRYDGFCEPGDDVWTSDLTAQRLTRVREGDIVISHINAIHGAIAIVPTELEGCVVTSEFTVCRPNASIRAAVLWTLLRSPEARADLLLLATGIGRTRVNWEIVRQLRLPVPPKELQQEILEALSSADDAERSVSRLRDRARRSAIDGLLLDSPDAQAIISAFKPPR